MADKVHHADWRGARLESLRAIIMAADADIVEERKWAKPSNPSGVPTWSLGGLITTGETYRDKVKLTFAYGASLDDPDRLFNASLDGKVRRAIDLDEGDTIDAAALTALVRSAVAFNRSRAKARR